MQKLYILTNEYYNIMASITKLDMSAEVLGHNNISTQKVIFGTKVIYTPTGSKVKAYQREYADSDGKIVQRILSVSEEKLEKEVAQARGIVSPAIGNTRLDMCISVDHQFAAFQVFKFANLSYHRASNVKIFEGSSAQLLANLFLNGK